MKEYEQAMPVNRPGTETAGSEQGEQKKSVRDALAEYRWMEMDIQSKTEQILSLKEAARKMMSPASESGAPGPRQNSAVEKAVGSMEKLENEISDEICQMVRARRRVMDSLNRLERRENRTILQLRYLNGKSWQEIADLMDCSLDTAYRVHRRALRELQHLTQGERQSLQ